MTTSRWTPHATVATLIERDGKFLIVEELANNTTVLNQPAGHLEQGESIICAAARETLEETGWEVKIENFLGIYTYAAPNGVTYHRYGFIATPHYHHAERPLDTGIIAAHWLTRRQLLERADQLRSPLVLAMIDDYLQGVRLPLAVIHEHS